MTKRNTEDPVLEAARATVLDFGVRRATLTEVARRAGLSRMTVYRRYSDAPELMRALMTSEFGEVLSSARARSASIEDPLERVVAEVIGTFEMLIEHPLLQRLLELEPEVLMPYLAQRIGEFQRGGRAALASSIERGQTEGALRAGDPALMAAAIELIGRGPVLASLTLSDEERGQLLDELRLMVTAYLTP